jgi:hypothetical protein
MKLKLLVVAAILLAGTPVAHALDVTIPLTVVGNQATGHISIAGFTADLGIEFESVTGLDSSALVATVHVVSLFELPALLLRLPATGISLPAEFPLLLRISPSSSSTLTFHGVSKISLHTVELDFRIDLPLSLFSAPNGGTFKDITSWDGSGSYRVGGDKGEMSEYLVLVDVRGIDGVITGKFNALQATLTNNAGSMPPAVFAALQARLTTARNFYNAGQTASAVTELTGFAADVLAQSGSVIPDTWRAHDSVINVAGLLRAGAGTLNFSLNRKLAGYP